MLMPDADVHFSILYKHGYMELRPCPRPAPYRKALTRFISPRTCCYEHMYLAARTAILRFAKADAGFGGFLPSWLSCVPVCAAGQGTDAAWQVAVDGEHKSRQEAAGR